MRTQASAAPQIHAVCVSVAGRVHTYSTARHIPYLRSKMRLFQHVPRLLYQECCYTLPFQKKLLAQNLAAN